MSAAGLFLSQLKLRTIASRTIAAQVVGIVVYENFVTLSLAITHVLQQEQSFAETLLGMVCG